MTVPTQTTPPKIRIKAAPFILFVGVILLLVVLSTGAVLYFFNPSSNGFYPICLFHRLTGLNCPGCGGTRSAYALLHGNLALALKDNALLILLLPIIALRGAWLMGKRHLGKPTGQFLPAKALWGLLAVTVIFTVLRNLPTFSFLSP